MNACGTALLSGVSGGGVNHPQGIAVDGAGTIWIGNVRGNSISEMTGASGTFLSPAAGFGADAALLEPYGVSIDGSGNVWVSNYGNNTLTQFIGVAVPIRTPLAGPPQLP